MHPILFKLGPLAIHSYGAMIAVGFAVTAVMIYRRAGEFGIDKDRALDLLILALVTGIIGARALYIALNLRYFIVKPLEIPNLSSGGLAWYGAFFAAIVFALIYCNKHRINLWSALDLVAPYIALSQGLGRVGCFLNGCCYGIEGHPVQLYSASILAVIFVILRLWQGRRRFPGEVFIGYCMLYAITRFGIDFLRADNPHVLWGLTLSQLISIPLFIVAAILFTNRLIKWKRSVSNSK